MEKKLSKAQALDRAQWHCSRRELCIADIKLKLLRWGMEQAESLSIIESLIQDRFIDEQRYATAFAREKARFNGWGPRKIEMALRAKSIPNQTVQDALTEAQQHINIESFAQVLEKKAKTIKYKNLYDLKNKLLRFALSRGFDYEKSIPIIDEILEHYQ